VSGVSVSLNIPTDATTAYIYPYILRLSDTIPLWWVLRCCLGTIISCMPNVISDVYWDGVCTGLVLERYILGAALLIFVMLLNFCHKLLACSRHGLRDRYVLASMTDGGVFTGWHACRACMIDHQQFRYIFSPVYRLYFSFCFLYYGAWVFAGMRMTYLPFTLVHGW
jgi:hypothetical protein